MGQGLQGDQAGSQWRGDPGSLRHGLALGRTQLAWDLSEGHRGCSVEQGERGVRVTRLESARAGLEATVFRAGAQPSQMVRLANLNGIPPEGLSCDRDTRWEAARMGVVGTEGRPGAVQSRLDSWGGGHGGGGPSRHAGRRPRFLLN